MVEQWRWFPGATAGQPRLRAARALVNHTATGAAPGCCSCGREAQAALRGPKPSATAASGSSRAACKGEAAGENAETCCKPGGSCSSAVVRLVACRPHPGRGARQPVITLVGLARRGGRALQGTRRHIDGNAGTEPSRARRQLASLSPLLPPPLAS